jgi:hypothetical protein
MPNSTTHPIKIKTMTTLTTTQQDLINQIITEFVNHNQASEVKKTKSLLGVDEIIDSVKRKNAEILRIKEHNKAVFRALEPIFVENYNSLYQEMNALGLNLLCSLDWSETYDGRRHVSIRVSMFSDRRSDLDFYFDAKVTGSYLQWEGKALPNTIVLHPVLLYSYNSEDFTFEKLCKHPGFRHRIKSMYEKKVK